MILFIKPKLHYDDIQCNLHGFAERQVENDKVYVLAEELTSLAHPTYEDNIDRRWEYFYIPVWRNSKTIAVPIWIMEYNKEFFGIVQSFGSFRIKKGNKDTEKFYHKIIAETLRFIPILKKDETVLKKMIPYDIRTGKIKGIYALEHILSQDRKKTILENYQKHKQKNIQTIDTSLNQYLDVAAICYKSAYKKPERLKLQSENLSNIDMYKRWADGRDGGMLSIKDWDSKKRIF